MRKGLVFYSLFIFLLGCGQYELTATESADLSSYSLENCQYVRNSAGHIVSWKTSTPITFFINKRVPEQWREVMKEAAQAWVSPSGTTLIRVKDEVSSSDHPAYDKNNIIYWIDTGALFNYQQGQTMARWKQSQIQDTDILINAKDFLFYAEHPQDNRRIHLKSLMIHEFGHALGLKHTKEAISVMYPELAFLQVRTDLAEDDLTSVKCEYR